MKYRIKAAMLAFFVSFSGLWCSAAADGNNHPEGAMSQGTGVAAPSAAEETSQKQKTEEDKPEKLRAIMKAALNKGDFAAGGVSLGDMMPQVISRQGTPDSVTHENTLDSYAFKNMIVKRTAPFLLSYSQRTDLPDDFRFPGKGVSDILVKGTSISTPRDIHVGSSREEVLRAYGRPLQVLWDGNGKSFYFRYGLGSSAMDFAIQGDKVSSIHIQSLTAPVKAEDISYDDGESRLFLGDRDFKVAGYEIGDTFKAHPFEEWEKKMANPKEEIVYFSGYAVRLTVKSHIISALFLTDDRMVTSRGLSLGDDVTTVDMLYGKPHRVEMNVSGSEPKTSYIYFSKGQNDVLIINFSKNKVEGIVSAMNPTK